MTEPDLALLRLRLLKGTWDHEVIDRLLAGIASHLSGEYSALAEKAQGIQSNTRQHGDDIDWGLQLGDQEFFLEEVQKLAFELAIMALYKKIEISTKRAVTITFPSISTFSHFKFNELKKALQSERIEVISLPNFRAFDELRCINNDIKHSGVVSSELAAYSGWEEGHQLSELGAAYRRLAPLSAEYVGELIAELIRCREASLRA